MSEKVSGQKSCAPKGRVEENVCNDTGDFVIRRADGAFAYQLAVVVDDAAQAVTQIVRGADLLSSTPRQIALQRSLGLPTPDYAHIPLVTNADGSKLGKRDGALPLPDLDEKRIGKTLALALRILGVGEVERDTPERMLAEALALPGLTTSTTTSSCRADCHRDLYRSQASRTVGSRGSAASSRRRLRGRRSASHSDASGRSHARCR